MLETLKKADKLYYQGLPSGMTDEQYDILVKQYKQETGLDYFGFTNALPLGDYKHSHFVKSLAKVYSINDAVEKAKNLYPVLITPKLDGLTLVNLGESEPYSPWITRGNGEIGQDVSHNFTHINRSRKYDVRGEGIILKEYFDYLKEKGYSNLRNAAAGISSKKTTEDINKLVTFFAYDILSDSNMNHEEELLALKEDGFNVVPYYVCNNEKELETCLKTITKTEFPYEIDGLVIKTNTLKDFGVTSKYPKNAFAFKWEAEQATTPLTKVDFQVGRTGKITPVLNLEEVVILNSKIEKVTAHNCKFFENLKICNNDSITIKKSGDVIPCIVNVVKNNNIPGTLISLPKTCPCCGSKLTWSKTNTDLYCINPLCSAQCKESINRFCKILGIKGLSDSTIDKIYEKYSPFIQLPCFISKLKKNHFLSLDGFKEKSSENLSNAIFNAFNNEIELYKVIASCLIPNVGETASILLAENFDNISDILNASIDEIKSIKGIGDEISFNLNDPKYIKILKVNASFFKNIVNNSTKENLETKGSVYITGTFDSKKLVIANCLKKAGYKVVSSYSSKTDFLLVGENPGKAKLNKFPEKEKTLDFFI